MTKIVVDEAVRAKLHNLAEPLELCDASGKILGHYVPTNASTPRFEPSFTADEVQRRRSTPGGRTLDEIWERLGRK